MLKTSHSDLVSQLVPQEQLPGSVVWELKPELLLV